VPLVLVVYKATRVPQALLEYRALKVQLEYRAKLEPLDCRATLVLRELQVYKDLKVPLVYRAKLEPLAYKAKLDQLVRVGYKAI
jgi:hypothetical protein